MLGLPAFPQLYDLARIRLRRDDADHVRDVVVEFLADCQQSGAVVRARDDPAEHAAHAREDPVDGVGGVL